ncbi:MAG: MBL fold metallo-hydrolase [Candidatus Aenigmarchaeota archaeon]|nr:MBL fold metallo-hydrolase [Candidatus Aenigmarchaeota archaeon]
MNEIEAKDLKNRIDNGERLFLLDVRSKEEYEDWRIEGSKNIPLDELRGRIDEISDGKEIITVCSHGVRSSMATQMLSGMGMDVKTLAGGMAEWNCIFDAVEMKESGYEIIQFRRPGKGCLSYMVASDGKAIVFDPSFLAGEYLETAAGKNVRILAVADTHQHADHISGARWLAKLSKARLYLNPAEGYRFSGYDEIRDGLAIRIGRVNIECIAAPGHTKGSTCFLINGKYLLTGDTLFIEGVGRPDLKENAHQQALQLYGTLKNKIMKLPKDTVILPGHFGQDVKVRAGEVVGGSLGKLKESLRILNSPENEFVLSCSNVPQKPPNHLEIIEINRNDTDLDEEHAKALEEGPNRCAIKG